MGYLDNDHYNVKPRYTPGSPGMVNESTARKVMRQELSCYEDALEGLHGEHLQKVAKTQGLLGIVELVYETGIGWEVYDLLTETKYLRAFTGEGGLSGLYELTCDFDNPAPDRRKARDWRYEVSWPERMRFVITPNDSAIALLRDISKSLPEERKLSESQIRQQAGHMITKARSKHRSSEQVKLSDLPIEFARSLRKVRLLHACDAFDLQNQFDGSGEDILCYIVDKLELMDPEQLSELLRQHYHGEGPFEEIPH